MTDSYECACGKDSVPTEKEPNTRPSDPEDSMESRFGSGYTILQSGFVETTNRFSNDQLRAMSREYANRKGANGGKGINAANGKKGETSQKGCASCGKAGRNGNQGM
tara:strand:- start:63 stop:383 length:321 start_codon:yes stop_codon:yes gene_type:complete